MTWQDLVGAHFDVHKLDVTNNIKVNAVHGFKRNVSIEEALKIWGNCTHCKIRYGDNHNILGNFDMLQSFSQGENESNLEL